MKMFLKCLLVFPLVVIATGCASGTKFSEFQKSVPQLNPDSGRIYFFRSAVIGAAIQPNVNLNDKVVGKAVPKGFFFVDTAPGEYKAVTSTEVKRTLSFTLDKGQTRYVQMKISMGFFIAHVYCELVDEKTAMKEIKNCKNTGPVLALEKSDIPK